MRDNFSRLSLLFIFFYYQKGSTSGGQAILIQLFLLAQISTFYKLSNLPPHHTPRGLQWLVLLSTNDSAVFSSPNYGEADQGWVEPDPIKA